MREESDEVTPETETSEEPTLDQKKESRESPESSDNSETSDPLAEAQKDAADWKDKYLRAHADFENTKKRLAKDKSSAVAYANESFAKDVLSVLDSLDQAITSIEGAEGDSQSEVLIKMKEGIDLTYGQLKKVLEKHHIKEIPSEGEFDPSLHQVIMQVESQTHQSGEIVQVMQKGYTIKERVLRPAMVSTAK
jgi:molecular chaperone GrpE